MYLDRGFVSKISKEHLSHNNKKTNSQIKNGWSIWIDISLKKICKLQAMKRCSTTLVIRKCKSNPQWHAMLHPLRQVK